MATQVWFRNPHSYIKELVETGEHLITWDRGLLVKKSVDPIKHAQLYYGEAYPWRVLAVGPQGTAEYRSGDTWEKPTAVYPTWEYGEDAEILEDMVANPAGEDRMACLDHNVDGNERPVFGQEHRVVITELPNTTLGSGRKFMAWIKALQEDNPHCILHLHGLYGFKLAFGMGIAAVDLEPRTSAQKGKVHLPSGREEPYEKVAAHPQWVTALGFKPVDLAVPRNRCMYNIKSSVWAGQHYIEMFKFNARKSTKRPDMTTPDASYKPPTTLSPFIGEVNPKEGDKQICTTCSLQDQCKFFREGSVCALPEAESRKLASYFKTRDADSIIDGLGILVAAGASRLETGMQIEAQLEDYDPEVTKLTNVVFNQGVQLAKLIDPNLRGGVKVNVAVGGNGQAAVQVGQGTPKALLAGVYRQLEAQGFSREQITPEMVTGVLAGMAQGGDQTRVIEGSTVQNATGS